ncbi:MAG: hypothetical protein DLM57_14520 [Pseudonocardiales bacterium]|nr:MAG: hypothetical protein DLM57_14520 [Pseudonocardiales bacterium]
MATQVMNLLMEALGQLRVQSTPKRVRALIGDAVAADTTHPMLVWEPGRGVPYYAVPVDDLRVQLIPTEDDRNTATADAQQDDGGGGVKFVPPGNFRGHTTDGVEMTVVGLGPNLPGAAFLPLDIDLAGYAILDFDAFDAWLEEDEAIIGHPRDPFHRIDVRRSSRHVKVSLDGVVLADSTRPQLVFETPLPVRYYLPTEDVRVGLVGPSATSSACAYKGIASYFTAQLPDREVPDIAWSYLSPLPDAIDLRGLMCFYNERVDIELDGQPLEQAVTRWS